MGKTGGGGAEDVEERGPSTHPAWGRGWGATVGGSVEPNQPRPVPALVSWDTVSPPLLQPGQAAGLWVARPHPVSGNMSPVD